MHPRKSQHGISLIIVLVMLLLTTLLIVGSMRVNLIGERLAGNNADYQRAYEAAEALLADAKLDLACANSPGNCGGTRTAATPPIPCVVSDFEALVAILPTTGIPCQNGICTDLGNRTSGDDNSFWKSTTLWANYTANGIGAGYGQFTNAAPVATEAVNPRLLNNARYWIEVLQYGGESGGRGVIGESTYIGNKQVTPGACKYVYRITAAAQGVKPGTIAVLQSYYMYTSTQF